MASTSLYISRFIKFVSLLQFVYGFSCEFLLVLSKIMFQIYFYRLIAKINFKSMPIVWSLVITWRSTRLSEILKRGYRKWYL